MSDVVKQIAVGVVIGVIVLVVVAQLQRRNIIPPVAQPEPEKPWYGGLIGDGSGWFS